MLELLTDALRQSVAEALGEIWKQRKELREAASKGTTADIEKADVSLFDHSATWTLKPSITIKVTNPPPGLPAFTIPLNVEVTFTLQNVQMEIERAHITKFMMGKLKSKVAIKYKEYPLSPPFEKTVDLPGELVLPGGGIDLS